MAGIFSLGLHCAGRKSLKACSASSSLCLFVEISGEASNVVVPCMNRALSCMASTGHYCSCSEPIFYIRL